MLHGLELLQIEKLCFEQTGKVLNHSVVQAVALPAHALPDALLFEHPLVLFVLILPALIRMKY